MHFVHGADKSRIGVNKKGMINMVEKVPIWQKINLTIEEASEYSNIGVSTLRSRISTENYDFVINVGAKKLINRKKFEKFLENVNVI